MKTLRIEPQKEGKGRTFSANLLGYVTADSLWELGLNGNGIRPVWVCYATSEGESRPFTANAQLGKKILISDRYRSKRDPFMELLRSAEYEFTTQRFPEGIVTTAFLPELFRLDPGMVDPKGAKFVMLPPLEWAASQRVDLNSILAHLRKVGYLNDGTRPDLPDEALASVLALQAPLFAAYLDRRTRAPLLQDSRFHAQILVASLNKGLAALSTKDAYIRAFGEHRRHGFKEEGTREIGLAPGVAFHALHTDIEAMLAAEVTLFLDNCS